MAVRTVTAVHVGVSGISVDLGSLDILIVVNCAVVDVEVCKSPS